MSIVAHTPLSAFQELQGVPQWVCYTSEKMPINPQTGENAKADDPSTWGTYQQAYAVWKRNATKYAGIGYEFVKSQGVTGVDLDHCIDEDGNVSPFAQYVVKLLNSYTEYSPSGSGLHIWVRGNLPSNLNVDIKNDGEKRIEAYDCKRYFTLTGNCLPGTPNTIENRQEQLLVLHTSTMERRKPRAKTQQPRQPQQGDTPYGLKALDDEFYTLSTMPTGGRNPQLYKSACSMGELIGGRELTRSTVESTLIDACSRNGLLAEDGEYKCNATMTGGIEKGRLSPRSAPVKKEFIPYVPTPIATNGNGNQVKSETLPRIIIGVQQLRDFTSEALSAIRLKHETKPGLFVHMSNLAKIAVDEEGKTVIMPLGIAALRNELSDAADFFIPRKGTDEEVQYKPIMPPKELAEQILALQPSAWPVKSLKAIVEAPVLRPDGSILDAPGYDASTKLYYVPAQGMEHCKVPCKPTQADAVEAMNFLAPIFADFPFEGDADRANAIGLLFTPFVRYAVKKDIQLAIIDATNAGTGKGLITSITSIAATGRPTSTMSAKKDDEEWAKSILTELLQGPRIVIIDNIRGVLESASLEMMLTGEAFNGRILGTSKSAKPKNEATWMATGNNLIIGGDLARRCYRIRMISQTATPEERTDFTIPDLEAWMHTHRSEVVAAILTIARAWYQAGKPKAANLVSLGTFNDWSQTIGGMLEFAGVTGWQGNREELRSHNNEDAQAWEAFLEAWYETYGSTLKGAKEVANEMIEKEGSDLVTPANALINALPQYLEKAFAKDTKTFHVVLANQLGKRIQTVYGSAGYRVEKMPDKHRKIMAWRVVRGFAGVDTSNPRNKNCICNITPCLCFPTSTGQAVELPPQTPANPASDVAHVDENIPQSSPASRSMQNNGLESSAGFAGVTLEKGLGKRCTDCKRNEAVVWWKGDVPRCRSCQDKENGKRL